MKLPASPNLCTIALITCLTACGGGGSSSTPAPSSGNAGNGPVADTPTTPAPKPSTTVPSTSKPVDNATPPAPPTGGDPLPPAGPVPPGNQVVGVWSSVVDWPLLSIHAALLPDGRVMTYGTNISARGGSEFMYDIFDPKEEFGTPASHLTLENRTGTFIFCSAQVLLPLSGELLISGGDVLKDGSVLNRGVADANIFSPTNNSLRPATAMKRPRWYSTSTVLPNGEIYLQGGRDGEDHPEIRGLDGESRLLTGIDTLMTLPNGSAYFENDYPRNFVAPNGKVFGFDHHWLYEVDPRGVGNDGNPGSVQMFASQWDIPHTAGGDSYRGWFGTSTAVMYQPGRILQLGGLRPNATIIDINDPTPTLTDLPPMSQNRQFANATVLPDGKVFVSGGSSKNLLQDPANRDVGEVAYHTEIFDPVTQTWSIGASLAVGRFYHSVALLLPDGTVLSSGGGAPGPATNLNAQRYFPGYLFESDGTRATRPVIDQVPGALPQVINPQQTFNLSSADTASIERVTLVKTGSVTHSFDMDQRFIEPDFSVDGDQIRVSLPSNPYETPPGYYMVFIIDDQGTPSEAKFIRINPANVPANDPA